jgi:Golgi nucleoside diphosphatase
MDRSQLLDGRFYRSRRSTADLRFPRHGWSVDTNRLRACCSVSDNNIDGLEAVRLRLLNGRLIVHRVFVTTWLGYGTNQARERYVGKLIQEHEKHHTSLSSDDLVHDPCLPPQLRRTETPVYLQPVDEHEQKPHILVGTGNFTECLQLTSPLLNKDAPCPDVPCLFAGKHVPHIDFPSRTLSACLSIGTRQNMSSA